MSDFNPSYVGPRDDVAALVPGTARRVLDVGCSTGVLGASIKQRNGARVVGVEMDPAMAEVAQREIDRVIVGDVERLDVAELGAEEFDCICFADVLEHLSDPWETLARFVTRLAPDGVVVASIPNVRHYSTIGNLLFRGRWPYRERGIHDRTHLRFFTHSAVVELFASAGLEVCRTVRKYRLLERPSRINRVSRWFAVPPVRDLLTFQYLVQARRPRTR